MISIKTENLGKKYILQHQQLSNYIALCDVITDNLKKVFYLFKKKNVSPAKEEFWALKDISFEINQGDKVGIIGRNGAGKTTLLKILSRVTEPTFGKVKIKGCVAILLEVGAEFHPELTGRENIFLSGVILGMKKSEIKKSLTKLFHLQKLKNFLIYR